MMKPTTIALIKSDHPVLNITIDSVKSFSETPKNTTHHSEMIIEYL